jgi:S-layer homology domain
VGDENVNSFGHGRQFAKIYPRILAADRQHQTHLSILAFLSLHLVPPMTESSRPESNQPDHPLPPPIPVSVNAAAEGLRPVADPRNLDRHKYDEIIAVVVALLGIGSILFWGWNQKGTPFNLGATPGALNSGAVNANGKIAAKLPDTNLATSDATASPAAKGPAAAVSPSPTAATGSGLGTAAVVGTTAATLGAASAAKTDAPKVEAAAPVEATPSVSPSVAASPNALLTNPGQPVQFKDVPADAAIAPYVAELSSRGVITGSDGLFRPDEPITRGQFAAMVAKGFNKPKSLPVKKFDDIKVGTPAAAAVDEAIQTGFMKGYSDKEFKPEEQIPRYQLQVALATRP